MLYMRGVRAELMGNDLPLCTIGLFEELRRANGEQYEPTARPPKQYCDLSAAHTHTNTFIATVTLPIICLGVQ